MKIVIALLLSVLSLSVNAEKSEYLKVIKVSENDTLNMRSSGNNQSELVMTIPYDANGLLKIKQENGWTKLSYLGQTGWAYSKYLAKSPAPSVKKQFSKELFCVGTEPHWIIKSQENQLAFSKQSTDKNFILDSNIDQSMNETDVWHMSAINTKSTRNSLTIFIRSNNQCSDGMSDKLYKYSIIIQDNNLGILSGCCN